MVEGLSVSEISWVKDFGFAAIAFLLVYVLLKQQQAKMFEQSKDMTDFAKNIVASNTEALTNMNGALMTHMKQKDEWMEQMKRCASTRDERLRDIEVHVIKIAQNTEGAARIAGCTEGCAGGGTRGDAGGEHGHGEHDRENLREHEAREGSRGYT